MKRPWLFLSTAARATAASAALAAVLALQSGCTSVECGFGTIERDGDCVAAEQATDDSECGEGTILDPSGQFCVPEVVCDPATTVVVEQPDGSFVCEGMAGGGALPSCDMALPCPGASGTTTTICGTFFDLETDAKLGPSTGPATQCDPMNPAASGACSYRLEFYDALTFSGGGTTQLDYDAEDLIYDSCGRFRVTGLQAANSGIAAVGARGTATGAVTSGIAVRVIQGGTYPGQKLYTVTAATNMKYSMAVGRADLRAGGVYVSIHVLPPYNTLNPAAGVTLTGASGGAAANFYFSDTDPGTRSMIGPTTQTVTGANGTAILIDQPATGAFPSSGGDLPAGCSWNSITGGNIPGVYFIQTRVPFEDTNPTEPCTL
jgi:hypothetical protein